MDVIAGFADAGKVRLVDDADGGGGCGSRRRISSTLCRRRPISVNPNSVTPEDASPTPPAVRMAFNRSIRALEAMTASEEMVAADEVVGFVAVPLPKALLLLPIALCD